MKFLSEIFDDWLVRAAGGVLALILVVLFFNTFSDLPYRVPILGMITFSLEPLLFVIGGAIFILALRRV